MGTLTKSHMATVLDKAATDPSFKQRFIADPSAVLAEHDIAVQDCCKIEVLEDSDSRIHLVIPWNTPVNHRLVEHRHFPKWVFNSDHGHHMEAVGRLVQAVWDDAAVRQRLTESPAALLEEYGLEVEGRAVSVHENSEDCWFIVLPH